MRAYDTIQTMFKNYIDLLNEFVKTDFKHRYKNSALGFLWMVIKPLALFSILYFIWTSIFRTRDQNSLFLLSGIMISNYFNDGITLGLKCLENKSHIILKINFPREVVIFSSTAVALINFLVNLGILLVFAIAAGIKLSFWGLLLVVFSLLTLYLLILSISFFTSLGNILMKDLHHLVELGLQMVFWGTPILYSVDQLPDNLARIIKLNPLTHILQAFRTGLLEADKVSINDFATIFLLFSIIFLFTSMGYNYFKPTVKRIAEFF